MSFETMSADELRELYRSMERRYLSAGERVETLEAQVLDLKAKNAIMVAERMQWDATKNLQASTIQQHLATMDAEKQEMAQTITELRARIKDD